MSNLIYENKVKEDVFDSKLDDQVAPELSDVILKKAPKVYLDPREFLASTYLTGSMKSLVNEITYALNQGKGITLGLFSLFGGGKTHTVLLLYHAFTNPSLARQLGLEVPDNVKVIGIGGKDSRTAPSPIDVLMEDGIEIKTLWGYIAKKLGKYDIIRKYDEDQISPPKDKLEELFKGEKVLILIDEIVFYLSRVRGLKTGNNFYEQCLTFFEILASVSTNLPVAVIVTVPANLPEEKSKEGGLLNFIPEPGYEEVTEALVKRILRVGKVYRAPIETAVDLANVLIKRIFKEINNEVKRRVIEEYQKYVDEFKDYVIDKADLVDTYPFHPLYINLLKNLLEGNRHLQGTREAIKITRIVIRNIWENKPTRSLILPSDISIKDNQIRLLLLKDYKNYDIVADTIIQRSKGLDIVFLLANYIFVSTYYKQLGLDPGPLITALPDSKEVVTSVLDPEYLNSVGKTPADVKDILDSISSTSKDVEMVIPYLISDKGRYWVTFFADPKTICEKEASKILPSDVEKELDEKILSLAEIPIDDIQKKKRYQGGRLLKLHRTVVRNLSAPVDIDEPSYYLIILGTPICRDCKDDEVKNKARDIARRFIYYTSSGKAEKPRKYSNTIVLLFSSQGNNEDKIKDYVRRYISCSNMNVDPYYSDKATRDVAKKILDDYVRGLEGTIYNQIFQYFDKVAYPYGNNDVNIVDLKSSGKTLLQQVEDTLVEESKIMMSDSFNFDTLKWLLQNINIDITNGTFKVENIKEMFYTNPSLPFVPESVLLNAIKEGVDRLEIGILNGSKIYYKKYGGLSEFTINDSSIIYPPQIAAEKEIEELSKEETVQLEDGVLKRYYVLELEGNRIPISQLRREQDWLEKFKAGEIKLVEEKIESGVEIYAEPDSIEGMKGETKEVKLIVRKIGNFNSKVYLSSTLGELSVKEGVPDFQASLRITLDHDTDVVVTAKYENKEKQTKIHVRVLQTVCEKYVDEVSKDSVITEVDIVNTTDLKNILPKLNSSIIGKKSLTGELTIEEPDKKISLVIKPNGSQINDFITLLSPLLSYAGLRAKVSGNLKVKVEEFKGLSDEGVKNLNELLKGQVIKINVKVC
ncbi:DUF499 domain-containing protein [Acidianus infernus]|uniref:DUF499 domain-containing protein n=1 Tax=Acidianus infernus TaxID=12915 RepID=A0A6A9QRE0_ACIIN|nr:DUF499 domain-containing protein [Acidianus infernus]